MEYDPEDDEFLVSAGQVARYHEARRAGKAKKAAGSGSSSGFVKVPLSWVARLEQATGCAYRVALHLLYQHWKQRGRSIQLANAQVAGVSRASKWRALRELEEAGLVVVQNRPRKPPLITLILAP